MDAKEFIYHRSQELAEAIDNGYDLRMSEPDILYWMESYSKFKTEEYWKNIVDLDGLFGVVKVNLMTIKTIRKGYEQGLYCIYIDDNVVIPFKDKLKREFEYNRLSKLQ